MTLLVVSKGEEPRERVSQRRYEQCKINCGEKTGPDLWRGYCLTLTQLLADLWPSYCRPRTGHRWSCRGGRGRRMVHSAQNPWCLAPGPAEQREAHTCCLQTTINHRSSNTILILFRSFCLGERDSSVVRPPDSWLKGRGFESLQERRENFLLQDQLSVLTPDRSAKSAGGRLQLNTHTPYVCGFAWSDMVHGCMVYTELTPRRQQFHVAPVMPAL